MANLKSRLLQLAYSFLVLQITAALAADNVKTSAQCEDISEECELHKKYCGKNAYVTSRCLKTCGACSK